MSQPPSYGPPQTPPPGWGQPPGQPYPGGPYGPPPPKKGLGAGAIVAIVLGSIVGLFVLLGIIGLAIGDDTTGSSTASKPRSDTPNSAPTKAAPEPERSSEQPKEQPADGALVTITAAKAEFTPSVLHDGGAYTSVEVTIINRGDEVISTNPLYFTVTDSDGAKYAAELGMDKHQMDLLKLAKGEKATGIITVKGKITPAYVTFTEGMFGNGVRGDVK
ncbi:DUF4352 domain-containing protein [Streptomyces sp. NPDC096319]|uniref:DUF4352 domain-containing protein n=1 Tax=Streptomyces sp. NPDC096319 TaxID=3366084 RepID=UPI00380B7BDF